ncbi:alpha beta hydrolase fold [Brachionus plicatilis]|uniref:Alpha beta hydrolase fold n=1 Tax=Brachionus plicatilis TaxID=10195 RepID=A0A3M7QIL8_BRAPC|nr:alpha beta hydrolase fold [Brachionus plicatilis]
MFATESLIGVWNATNIQTFPLILLAHIFLNGNDYAGYIEVPERNLKIRIDIFNVNDPLIDFNMTSIKTSFEGHLNGLMIQGIWKNASMEIPIQFKKVKNHSKYEVKRPQTPKRPFSYIEEEIELKNLKANISLSGTFTCPKNQKPIASVVLCHGSGGHDRDVTMFDHKPFMVLADYLSNNGIAVLRFDERGIRKSSGNFSAADIYDFVDDVLEGIRYLKDRKETNRLFNSSGQTEQNWKTVKKKILADLDSLFSPMLRSALKLQPGKILSRTKIPVLGIWGSNDLEVPPSVNFKPMKKALELARNKNFKLLVIDQLNHGMQKSQTGQLSEYERSEETISPFFLEIVRKWIHEMSLKLNNI